MRRLSDFKLFTEPAFKMNEAFHLALRVAVEFGAVCAAGKNMHRHVDKILMILGAAGINTHFDHRCRSKKVCDKTGLFGIGILVVKAPLIKIGMEVCHNAVISGRAVAVAVEPGLRVGVEDLERRTLYGLQPFADEHIVAAGVLVRKTIRPFGAISRRKSRETRRFQGIGHS